MAEAVTYLECWARVAASLFSQALVGEPVLVESLPKPLGSGAFGFAVTVEGQEQGRFSVMLDGGLAEAALLGEGMDQQAGWAELVRETVEAAAGELLAKTGRKVQVRGFAPIAAEGKLTQAYQLKAGDRNWQMQVLSEVRVPKTAAAKPASREAGAPAGAPTRPTTPASGQGGAEPVPSLSPGLNLLLDVELEASLRFGAREMPLAEILDLGPGDVVQLDRHVSDPVDLIVGDKIVARGEVVLVNGNFGLRVTEVAEPQRRLESIRCLF